MSGDDTSDSKHCPLCGEVIKRVAVRCKHCHADLTGIATPAADFDRHEAPGSGPSGAAKISAGKISNEEFERRFLDFAYETRETLTAISVAHALKIPIALADERLESLAAADVILRDVDDEGGIFYALPGRKRNALAVVPGGPLLPPHLQRDQRDGSGDAALVIGPAPPTEAAAVTGLVLNLCLPGVGSIVAGKPGPGVAQLAMLVAGIPLCFVLIGFPLVFASWLWALMTAATALQESRRATSI